jgi:PAS domain S-box-containing protein
LHQSEKYYRELFKSAQDAIWVQGLSGFITEVNEAGERMTGYSRDELLGVDVRKFLAPESLGVAKEVRRHLLSGGRLDQPYDQRVTRKDGSEVYLKLSPSSPNSPPRKLNTGSDQLWYGVVLCLRRSKSSL